MTSLLNLTFETHPPTSANRNYSFSFSITNQVEKQLSPAISIQVTMHKMLMSLAFAFWGHCVILSER
jgi:hypothetical protein